MGCFSSWQQAVWLLSLFPGQILGEELGIIPGAMHTILNVECTPYFSFQNLAFLYTFKRVGMTGPLTRIMACSPEQRQKFSQEDMEMMNTHITPQYAYDDVLGDEYTPYNRPIGILHWLEHAKPLEEWVLFVDPDMLFRYPILPNKLRVPKGWARAAHYVYLEGTRNELADKHIPDVKKREDNYGGKEGRRADEAGAFFFLRMEDMKKVAASCMNFTRGMRADPDAWRLTGDGDAVEGEPVWISEMYGWVYSMARNNIWHLLEPTLQVHPSLNVRDIPQIIHYGFKHTVLNYQFDKHLHREFDFSKCPPWNLQANRSQEEDGGLFPHPPFPTEVGVDPMYENTTSATGRRYGKLLVIEAVNTLNEALCERHHKKCSISQELVTECKRVKEIRDALNEEFHVLDKIVCFDINTKMCQRARKSGQCEKLWLKMHYACRESCGLCSYESLHSQDQKFVQSQPANLFDHPVEDSPRELRPKLLENAREQPKSKLMDLQTKCGKMTVEEVRGDLECATWSLQYGLKYIDFSHMNVDEHEALSFGSKLLVLASTVATTGFLYFLTRCSSGRPNPVWKYPREV